MKSITKPSMLDALLLQKENFGYDINNLISDYRDALIEKRKQLIKDVVDTSDYDEFNVKINAIFYLTNQLSRTMRYLNYGEHTPEK